MVLECSILDIKTVNAITFRILSIMIFVVLLLLPLQTAEKTTKLNASALEDLRNISPGGSPDISPDIVLSDHLIRPEDDSKTVPARAPLGPLGIYFICPVVFLMLISCTLLGALRDPRRLWGPLRGSANPNVRIAAVQRLHRSPRPPPAHSHPPATTDTSPAHSHPPATTDTPPAQPHPPATTDSPPNSCSANLHPPATTDTSPNSCVSDFCPSAADKNQKKMCGDVGELDRGRSEPDKT